MEIAPSFDPNTIDNLYTAPSSSSTAEIAPSFNPNTIDNLYTAPSSSFTPGGSPGSTSLDSATEAAIQAGAYLGYMAMLQNYLTGKTSSDYSTNPTVVAASNEANRIGAILSSFYNEYTSATVPSSISAVWNDVGTALSTLKNSGGSAMASWYASNATSPVSDIASLLSSVTTANTQFSPDTEFALMTFMLSGNLQVGGNPSLILQTTLSTSLETLLGDANEATNPFDNGNWMAAFLDSYVQSNTTAYDEDGDSTYTVKGINTVEGTTGSTITGGNTSLGSMALPTQAALLAAILPGTSSSTPNYNGFYSDFTGSSSTMNYATWIKTNQTYNPSTLQGVMFWDKNTLPTN